MMVRSTVPVGCQISLESCWERFTERQGDLSVATATKELQGTQGPHPSADEKCAATFSDVRPSKSDYIV